ncbi:MAG: PAS domain S-box protein [Phycisphaerae bacterium]
MAARMRGIYDAVSAGVLVRGEDGRLTHVNPAACRKLETTQEEILAKDLDGLGIRAFSEDGLELPPTEFPSRATLASGNPIQGLVLGFTRQGSERKRWFLIDTQLLVSPTGRREAVVTFSDMTGQKQAEAELLHSERSYREIFNATGEALIVHDAATGALLDANEAAQEFYGHAREELVGMSLEEFIRGESPYGPVEARAHVAQAARLGQLRFDWLFTNTQGGEAWCDVTLRSAEINGRSCVVGAVRDTSEHRATEEALRLSEQKLRSTLRAAPVGFGILRNRQFMWMNDEMSRMLGYPPDELLGRSIRLLYETELEYTRVGEHVYRWMGQEGIGLTETRYVRKDGSTFDAHVQVSPIEPGDPDGRVAVAIIDVTDRKAAELALRNSQQRLQLALEATREALWDYNLRTGQTYLSPRWYAMLGYEDGEVTPTVELWESMVHPDDLPLFNNAIAPLFDGSADRFEAEFRIAHKSGRWLWVCSNGQVMERGSDGSPLRIVGTSADITDRKRMTADLKEANAQLQRKNIALQELMAGIRRERFETADRIRGEIDRILLPLAGRLEERLDKHGREYLQALLDGIREAVSPLERTGADPLSALSPAEVRVCTLVRRGLSAKEIAHIESISPATVNTHRARIRQKLGITGQKVNLASHLEQLLDARHAG